MCITVQTTDYETFSEFHYFTTEERAQKFIDTSLELGFEAWIVGIDKNVSITKPSWRNWHYDFEPSIDE